MFLSFWLIFCQFQPGVAYKQSVYFYNLKKVTIFYQLGGFSFLFSMRTFAIYTKKKQYRICKICICCLDNSVKEINWDLKQNNWDFNAGNIIFSKKWCPIVKTACLGKIWISGKKPKFSPLVRVLDYLNFNISKSIWGIMFIFCMYLDIPWSFS